ncbi:MAG TPA: addiction module protein [Burkholderiaceae bacterium]
MSAIYDQIKQLTRTERLELVQEIWDGLAQEVDGFELTAAQAIELDRRLAQHRLDPSGGTTLDELAARLGVRV